MLPPPRPTTPNGRHFWHTEATTAKPADVWRIWTDVAHWADWDDGLTSATLSGPFRAGATGSLVADGRTSHFTVTQVAEGQAYTFRTKFPVGGLNIRRSLRSADARTEITHEVWFDGPLRPVFGFLLGRKWRKMLPAVVQKVTTLAEACS